LDARYLEPVVRSKANSRGKGKALVPGPVVPTRRQIELLEDTGDVFGGPAFPLAPRHPSGHVLGRQALDMEAGILRGDGVLCAGHGI
jgi:hypothetical protein